jgi:hypothetical protein
MESQLWAIGIKEDSCSLSDLRSRVKELATVSVFKVPKKSLRVGTLDSLMSLSDDLAKMDILAEATVTKLYKQLQDLKPGEEANILGGTAPAPSSSPIIQPHHPAPSSSPIIQPHHPAPSSSPSAHTSRRLSGRTPYTDTVQSGALAVRHTPHATQAARQRAARASARCGAGRGRALCVCCCAARKSPSCYRHPALTRWRRGRVTV